MTEKPDFSAHGINTPEFSLLGTAGWARVVHCHDGDSPTIILPVFGQMFKFVTRLYGIDTCEIASNAAANRDIAVRGRNRLIDLITNGVFSEKLKLEPNAVLSRKEIQAIFAKEPYVVWVECLKMDKYGRVLVKMRSNPTQTLFADTLIEEKLAYVYEGRTKLSEAEQLVLLS